MGRKLEILGPDGKEVRKFYDETLPELEKEIFGVIAKHVNEFPTKSAAIVGVLEHLKAMVWKGMEA